MNVTWLDFESELSCPGYRIPFPAIATTYHVQDGARLWLTHQLPELLERLLSDDSTAVGTHNGATFDAPIIAEHLPWLRAALWRKIESGQFLDTMIAQRQIQINRGQKGPLNLGDCARSFGMPFVDKKDAEVQRIRTSFGSLIGATEIPQAQREYALNDAAVLHDLFDRQMRTGLVSLSDMQQLVQQQFDLALVAARGIRTDPRHLARLEVMVADKIAELQALAQTQGFLHPPKRDGTVSRNMKAIQEAIARAYDAAAWPAYAAARTAKAPLDELRKVAGRIPLTEKGGVSTDRLTLEDAPSKELQDLSEWSQILSIRNKDLPIFRGAVHAPAHTRFGIADTSRATSGGEDAFNAQNFGKLAGVRECVKARDGYGLAVSDYKMLELVSIAQLIVERLGLRTMAGKINAKIDMHAEIGADLLGITYEEIQRRRALKDGSAIYKEAAEARDCGKPYNFGTNGGLSKAETFQLYARKSYGMNLSLELCERILEVGKRRGVDQQAYLESIRQTGYYVHDPEYEAKYGRPRKAYDCPLPRFENLTRRGLSRTEASNNPFQCLGMRIAARGLHYVLREQYLPNGRMHGSHVIMFVHDDVTSEVPLDRIQEHATLQADLMCQASREECPNVFAGVDTRVLSHLSKGAEASKDAEGRFTVTQVTMPESIGG